jgi:hypothetical protein
MFRQELTVALILVFIIGVGRNSVHAQKIYWTTDTIRRADLDGSNAEDVIAKYRVRGPYGLAIDLSGGKMYWTSGVFKKIQRANLDGSNLEDLITSDLVRPSGIAVDPAGGKMYWVDTVQDLNPARIRRAGLDGSDLETVVTDPGGFLGIALDLRASGDCDLDSVITLADHDEFVRCMAGPGASPPQAAGVSTSTATCS